jgi:ATP-dependent Lon protease
MVGNGIRKAELKFTKPGILDMIENYTREAGVRSLQRQIGSICRKTAMRVAEKLGPAEPKPAPPDVDKGKGGKAFPADPPTDKSSKTPPPAGGDVALSSNGSSKPKTTPVANSTIITEGGAPKVDGGRARIKPISVKPNVVRELLGPAKTYSEVAQRMGQPGVAIGMAWTPTGGEILFIEATRHPGSGKLILTGSLGDIMKESAQAALTHLHARAADFGIEDEAFSKNDIHVHVPAGAVPKDGPSAGSALATALASLLTGSLVKDYLSMTGEITLRGNILPVGGVKEKCLAAQRAGIKTILLPKANERDFEDIPEEVRTQIKFHFVERIDEVLSLALKPNGKGGKSVAGKSTGPAVGGQADKSDKSDRSDKSDKSARSGGRPTGVKKPKSANSARRVKRPARSKKS